MNKLKFSVFVGFVAYVLCLDCFGSNLNLNLKPVVSVSTEPITITKETLYISHPGKKLISPPLQLLYAARPIREAP